MAAAELKVPSAGESVQEVQVGEWRKGDGDYVERDEGLVEIETDKAAMELPSPVSGRLAIRKQKGEIAQVGDVLATVEESAEKPAGKPSPRAEQPPPQRGPVERGESKAVPAPAVVMPGPRRALAESGLSPEQVQPTGPGGRLLKEDVLRAESKTQPPQEPSPPQAPALSQSAPAAPAARRDRAHVHAPPALGPAPRAGPAERRHADHVQRGGPLGGHAARKQQGDAFEKR